MRPVHRLHPTLDLELNAVLHKLITNIQAILADNFIGAYLHGSFALGDWDADSDVDFLIVLNHDVSAQDLALLQAMHGRIYDLGSKWAKHLEGSYFPRALLKQQDSMATQLWYLDNTSRELIRSTHDNNLVVRWIAREYGIALAGPPPTSLIDYVPEAQLREEVLLDMQQWAGQLFANPEKVNNRWYQPFAVLSYCRMLYTLHTGRIESKPKSARWGQAKLDPHWSPLIQRAWAERPNPSLKVRQAANPADLSETFAFISYALELGNSYMHSFQETPQQRSIVQQKAI